MDAHCLHFIIMVYCQVNVCSQVRARKLRIVEKKKDGKQIERNIKEENTNGRKSELNMKQDENNQNSNKEEFKVKQLYEKKPESLKMDEDIETGLETWQWGLETNVTKDLQANLAEGLDTNIPGDFGTNAVEVQRDSEALAKLDSDIEEVLETNVSDIREDLEMDGNQLKESGNENDQRTKPRIPRNEDDALEALDIQTDQALNQLTTYVERTSNLTSIQERHRNDPIGDFPGGKKIRNTSTSSPEMLFNTTTRTEPTTSKSKPGPEIRPSLMSIKKLNHNDATNGLSAQERIRTRRASSPDLFFNTTTQTGLTATKPKLSLERRPSLMSINEVRHDNATSPLFARGRIRTRRASSPELLFCTKQTEPKASKAKQSSEHRPNLTSIKEVNPNDVASDMPERILSRRASSPNLLFTTTQTEPTTSTPSSGRKPHLTSIKEINQNDATSDTPTRERALNRRASSPNLLFSATSQTAPTTGALNPCPERKASLISMQKLGNTLMKNFSPSEQPVTITRRSPIAVMTGVANPLIPGSPVPNSSPRRSLPELSNCCQGSEKYDFKRDSVQENLVHESLRKISRRLTTPLNGAQLEKRLQAHRVGPMSAALPTTLAGTPGTKSPSELDMTDLEGCRYIRRRTYSK